MNHNNHISKVIEGLTKCYDSYQEASEVINEAVKYVGKNKRRLSKAVRMIDSHRSLWIAKQNLQDYSCATAGRAVLEAIDAFLEENTSVTESDIKTLVSLVGKSGYCLIKGAAVSQYYRNKYRRQYEDIDFLVDSINEGSKIATVLQKIYTVFRIKEYHSSDQKTYTIDLVPRFINHRFPPIDIHTKPYYCWGGVLFEPDASTMETKLAAENQLLYLLAHTANQWFFRMRDITDFYWLIKEISNWKYIKTNASRYSLDGILRIYFDKFRKVYNDIGLDEDIFGKMTWYEKLFMAQNYGKLSCFGAIPISFHFSYQNYKRQHYKYPFFEAFYNVINLILYRGRAFMVTYSYQKKNQNCNRVVVYHLSKNKPSNQAQGNKDTITPTMYFGGQQFEAGGYYQKRNR